MGLKRAPHSIMGLALTCLPLGVAPTALAQEKTPPAVDPSLAAYASTKDSVRLPDGRTIHMVCMGQGSPTVILTAGEAGWGIAWNKVQPGVAARTRVCAWDRAGLALSSPSPKPPTVDNAAADLDAALAAGGIAGPYVVVGHSLGAYESLLLADREPSKVVGMVLVDPAIPDQAAIRDRVTPAMAASIRARPDLGGPLKKCAAALRAGTLRYDGPDPDRCLHPQWPPSYPPQLRAALDKGLAEAAPETTAAALEMVAASISATVVDLDSKIVIKPDRNYGSMPLIVLTAGESGAPPDPPAELKAEIPLQQAEWRRAHNAYAALSTRGVDRIVADSTHDIPQLRPQVVIDAIDEVVSEARAAAVVVALPCKTCPIARPSTPEKILHRQSLGLNR